jgi:hypothetical protein
MRWAVWGGVRADAVIAARPGGGNPELARFGPPAGRVRWW